MRGKTKAKWHLLAFSKPFYTPNNVFESRDVVCYSFCILIKLNALLVTEEAKKRRFYGGFCRNWLGGKKNKREERKQGGKEARRERDYDNPSLINLRLQEIILGWQRCILLLQINWAQKVDSKKRSCCLLSILEAFTIPFCNFTSFIHPWGC
jgi:hypothetical protein